MNGFELAFHGAGHDQCGEQADANGDQQTSYHVERPLGQRSRIIRRSCFGLCDKFVAQTGVGIKSRGVFSFGQGIQKLPGQIFLSGVSKGGDAVSGGGDGPFPVVVSDQQQDSIGLIAVLVVKIIGKGRDVLSEQVRDSNDHHVQSLPGADLVQLVQQRCFFTVCQIVCVVNQPRG